MSYSRYNNQVDDRINLIKNLLYIHIPKTAGTSIIYALGLTSTSHIKAREILNISYKHLLKDKFSFGVVRNPIDRFISLYNYARLDISYYHNNIEPSKGKYGVHLDYNLLKNASINDCVIYLMEGKLKHDKSWNHWLPQYTWLFNESKQLLVTKVYKLENIEELMKDLSEMLDYEIKLPMLNQSSTEKTKTLLLEELSKESLDLLKTYYENDFKLLGY